jgi:hypothetical protein
VSFALTVGGLAACTSLFGGEDVKIRAVENVSSLTGTSHDSFYESAVSAINARDYGRALDYLQEARARDPRNVKALNALGVVYDKLGRFDLSARYYAQARAVEPASRIVAENAGYSKILQGLLNPNQKIAVATIDLPANLNSASSEQPTMVVPDAPVVIAPAISPEKLAAATPASSAVVTPAVSGLEGPGNAVSASAAVALDHPAVVVSRNAVPVPAVNKKIFTIGQPIRILNASGKRDRVGVVTRRLGMLGWTVRQSDAGHVQPTTSLLFPAQNIFAAKAMQRTLPFPVRLMPGAGRASAMQLVIGRDYLSWKPRNARLATLWQRGTIVASLQRPSIRGAR